MQLRALYYPYSRSFDRTFLKHSILIFDELCFTDPMERAVRQSIWYYDSQGRSGHERWDEIHEDYSLMEEKGYLRIIDPCPTVREYDGLMAQAMLCDLKDIDFMKLASEMGSRDYWGIYRRKFEAGELLADALTFYGTRFWENPRSIKSPSLEGHRDQYYGTYSDFSSPFIMTVEHDYIPISCGYSVNVNLALLMSQENDLVPLTDDVTALRLLNMKYERAKKSQEESQGVSSIIVKRTPEYLQKLSLLAINICEALVPSQELDKRSFAEIIKFKESERESFERFRSYLLELTSQLNAEPWSRKLEDEIIKLIDGKIVPGSQKVRDDLSYAYEKMFGGIVKQAVESVAKKSVATVMPTLAAAFLAGLSPGQILTLSCAAVASALTISLPEIVDLWQEKRKSKRNGLSFLIELQKQ